MFMPHTAPWRPRAGSGARPQTTGRLAALAAPVFYLGCLGSTRTHAKRVDRLTQDGFTPDQIAKIHAPVGLDIGARTPAEIAVCIMAEIINVLRGGPALALSEQIRHERAQRRDRVERSHAAA